MPVDGMSHRRYIIGPVPCGFHIIGFCYGSDLASLGNATHPDYVTPDKIQPPVSNGWNTLPPAFVQFPKGYGHMGMLPDRFQAFHTVRCNRIFNKERIARFQLPHNINRPLRTEPFMEVKNNSHFGPNYLPDICKITDHLICIKFRVPGLSLGSILFFSAV